MEQPSILFIVEGEKLENKLIGAMTAAYVDEIITFFRMIFLELA